MFPTYERQVLETFLEMNGGKMESTVEQLLGMEAQAASAPPPPTAAPGPPRSGGAPRPQSAPTTPPWRQPLPPDFLVLPPALAERFSGAESQLVADQRMAEMLQSAYFFLRAVRVGGEGACAQWRGVEARSLAAPQTPPAALFSHTKPHANALFFIPTRRPCGR